MRHTLHQHTGINDQTTRSLKLSIICLLIFCSGLCAQGNQSFTATLFSGEFWYQKSGKNIWTKVSYPGKAVSLGATDKIKLGTGAQLALGRDDDFNLIEKPGTWIVNQLIAIKDRNQQVTAPYFAYLIKNLTHEHKSIDEYAEGYMRKKGLISRGQGCIAPLMVSPEFDAFLSGNATEFKWLDQKNVPVYTIAFYRELKTDTPSFLSLDVKGTAIMLPLDTLQFPSGVTGYWSAFPKGEPNCIRYPFKIPDSAEVKEFNAKLNELTSVLSDDVSVSALIKASFYEQNHFYDDATREYKTAMAKYPDTNLIKDSFKLFLARNGRLSEAKQIR